MTTKTEDEEKYTCCNCENELEEEREGYHNLCDDCYNDEYFTCERCDRETTTDDDCQSDNRDVYCADCYSAIHRKCESCDCEMRLEDTYTSNKNDDYCASCYYDVFTRCEECNCEITLEYAFNDGESGPFCEGCYSARGTQTGLHVYSYKPSPVFYGNGDNLFLGVELEVEGNTEIISEIEKPELYFKEDGSLNAGFEIVSHPATLAHHKGLWTNTLNTLKTGDAKSFQTETCGVHVHVNKNFLTETEKIKLGLFVYGQKQHVEHIARRSASKWSVFKDKKISEMTRSSERYEALNWQNRHTIEFRVFKGNLKPESFFSYLEFVHATCNFVKTENSVTIANNSKAWELFNQYLVVNKAKYINLVNFLKEGN